MNNVMNRICFVQSGMSINGSLKDGRWAEGGISWPYVKNVENTDQY